LKTTTGLLCNPGCCRLQLQPLLPLAAPPAALNHGQGRRPPSHGCRPKHRTYQLHPRAQVGAQAAATEVDVAVIGGGIIGLCVALELLSHASHLSVALIERQVPCSGATGAGATIYCFVCGPASLRTCCHSFVLHPLCLLAFWQAACVLHAQPEASPHASDAPSTHESTHLVNSAELLLHLLANAGQGYIWLAHRQPNSPGWAIAQRSKQLWENMIDATETPSKNGHRSKKLGRKADIEWQVTPMHCSIWLCTMQLCCPLAFRAATQVLLSCLSQE